jgi:RNA polymerase sigma-70 factor (ECF subfamily)
LVGEHDAEDLTQEVFLKISESLKDFKGHSHVSTWIYRIATNTALDKLRSPSFKRSIRKKSSKTYVPESDEEVEDNDVWSGDKPLSIEEVIVNDEKWKCFREFVNKLPLDHRAVFLLSDLRGLTNKEIAAKLGISLAMVKIRLHRGRAKLRKELEAHCGLVRDSRNRISWDGKRI